jgi:hypothetical protein
MRSFTAFFETLFFVAAGVNRLISPWRVPKLEPTHPATRDGYSRFFLWSAALALLTLWCGCRTTTQSLFTATGPGWHVQQGQALWRPKQGLPEFGGDLILASDANGRCLLQFDKTPLSMVFAQNTPDRWLIRFPQQQYSFSGHGQPPTRFAWLYLHAALTGEQLPPSLHFERRPQGGWRLENSSSGEILEGFLSP